MGRPGYLDVGHLVAAGVAHGVFIGDEAVLLGVIEELGSRVGVSNRNLNGFYVEGLGEVDRILNRLFCLAREAKDKVAMNDEAEVVAILGEGPRPLDSRAFLDVLQGSAGRRTRSRR